MSTLIERLEALAARPRGQGEGHVSQRTADFGAELWECGGCGFSFPVEYTDDGTDDGTDGYSCPACFEHAVGPVLPALLNLARVAEAQQTCRNFLAPHSCLDPSAGRSWDSPYTGDRVCDPCRLRAALEPLFREEAPDGQ